MKAVHQIMGNSQLIYNCKYVFFFLNSFIHISIGLFSVGASKIKSQEHLCQRTWLHQAFCGRTLHSHSSSVSPDIRGHVSRAQTSVSPAFWCSWLRRFWRCRRPEWRGRALRWQPWWAQGWTESGRGQTSSPAGRRWAWHRTGHRAYDEPGSGRPQPSGWVWGRQLGRPAGWRPCWGRPELPWWLPALWIWPSLNYERAGVGEGRREDKERSDRAENED